MSYMAKLEKMQEEKALRKAEFSERAEVTEKTAEARPVKPNTFTCDMRHTKTNQLKLNPAIVKIVGFTHARDIFMCRECAVNVLNELAKLLN